MKKVNIRYEVGSAVQFTSTFPRIISIFSSGEIVHLELNLVLIKLPNSEINKIIADVSCFPLLSDIESENILTLIFTIPPAIEMAKPLYKIKSHLARVDVIFGDSATETTIAQLQKKELPCAIISSVDNAGEILEASSTFASYGVPITLTGEVPFDGVFFSTLEEWIFDRSGSRVSPFSDIISALLMDHWGSTCHYKSCLTKNFKVSCDDVIFLCKDRDYAICSINQISTLDELYSHPNFLQILEAAVKKREICKDECSYYQLCLGGCPLEPLEDVSQCNETPLFEGMTKIKAILHDIINKADYGTINPAVRDLILSSFASGAIFEKGLVD